jgi:uncharacterized protein Yka (UPF0111/DUF47 family)
VEKGKVDRKQIKAYLDQVDECRNRFRVCIERLLLDPGNEENQAILEEVHRAESKADDLRRNIERDLIRDIFNSKLDKADMILFKEIVINTGDISDQAETVKDRLILAIVKRKI